MVRRRAGWTPCRPFLSLLTRVPVSCVRVFSFVFPLWCVCVYVCDNGCRVPASARLVVSGLYPRGTGVLQVYEMETGALKKVAEVSVGDTETFRTSHAFHSLSLPPPPPHT